MQISARLVIPDDELQWSFARSSGPGGQNVNKVNSKAILHWNILASTALPDDVRARFLALYGNRVNDRGEVVISCQTSRDQAKNIDEVRQRLTVMITGVLKAPKVRRATKPSYSSKVKRLEGKKTNSAKKQNRRAPGME